ncbi:UDP-N-acetylmuramoyl-tripeptide--D-alanyl-D-alanine ligase [mine drainage metagenome]|uniref:UDP-MurNAc-pentapeptide synthetase n=1 Tax=mine drainage metagenome TaxID=410659 RepID=A0A1J5R0I8_9ZZZZ
MNPAFDSCGGVLHALRALGACGSMRSDTRLLRAGDVFVAWPGAAHDPRRHVDEALRRGAVAVLVEADGAGHAAEPRVLAVRGLQRLAGEIADAWYGHPSRHMTVLAVTGTNGKTSCALWVAQALGAAGRRCGVVGTLGVGLPDELVATGLTTPDPVRLHHELAAMRERGVLHCAIEASSIGIEEQRLAGVHLHAAAFTNLTQDHLDYHGSMAAYAAAKRRLFDWPGLQFAVCNIDDASGAALAIHARQRGLQVATTSLQHAADWQARLLPDVAAGMRVELRCGAHRAEVELPLVGRFNVANMLVVCALLRSCGLDFDTLVGALGALSAPPGRMQLIGAAPMVVVDYAHTPDALAQVLQALRPLCRERGGQLWCVFGAGGDRDRSKRAPMAAAVEAFADRIVLSSDNPRSEAPQDIIDDLLQGLVEPTRAAIVLDRAQAIAQTLAHAQPADVVLLAGKGHEPTQEALGVRRAFSDAFHARAALAARGAGWFTLRELAGWVGGRLHGDGALGVQGISTDTRRLQRGDLFVALRGERFDANTMLAQAAAAGAAAVLAERDAEACAGLPGVQVADGGVAFARLALAWRRQQPALPLIAVTGSNGKTTVTQMIASILRAWHGDDGFLATQGNLNNAVGLPLTLLRLRPGHQAAVVELGMNHVGEIAELAAIAEPTIALVNNAQREHQEFMHTVEAVARENGSVLSALPANGVAVFPADDRFAALWAELAGERALLRFALREPGAADAAPAEVRGWIEAADADAMQLALRTPAGDATLRLQLLGAHNAHNALAATAAALAAGAPLAAVVDGLQGFRAVAGRMQRHALRWRDGRALLLIDDTYNANPDSVRAAIELLAQLPGRRLLLLGDMGEVGANGDAFHAEVGALAAARGVEALWSVGHASQAASAAAVGLAVRHLAELDALDVRELAAFDAVLVKGSRFMRMERVLRALQESGVTEEGGHAA